MSEWGEALVFGLTVLTFALGLSSIIMGLLPAPAGKTYGLKEKVEYGFFGVTGLVLGLLLSIALAW